MNETLSPNAQAILLLTAPLIVGRGARSETPLSAGEYGRLAFHLRDSGLVLAVGPISAVCQRDTGEHVDERANQPAKHCFAVLPADGV